MIIGKTRTNQPVESSKEFDDKVKYLPLPATASQDGKVLAVNSGGTGYELKPIEGVSGLYCHPILLVGTGTDKIYLACLIFDNSSEEINTWEKFKTKVLSWGVTYARIPTTGSFVKSDTQYIATLIGTDGNNDFMAYAMDSTGGNQALNITSATIDVYDGVNQIL